MPPPKNNNKPKLKDEIVDYNSIKFGIRIPESQNGDSLFMKNPQSSATGLYGQKYSELKKLPEYKDISRDKFAKDTVLQNKVFDDRFNGKLKDIPGLKKTGEDLYNEYKKSTKYNATQIAAISNLLGRYGTKKYLGYVERDGKTLEEVFPNRYGDKIKVKNKTPDEYLEESKLIKKPIVKPAKPINKSVQPINKPIKPSNKKLEDNDSWLENIVEFVDPTGVTSYDDVYRSYKNTGLSGETALEALGALPLVGKIGKSGKIISGGFGLLQDTVKAAQYLPSKQQKQVVDKAFDLYQKYSKSGGKEFDELLGSSTKFIKDNVNLLNPEMVKSSDKLINAYNTTFKTGKAYDAYQAATGSKNNSGLKRTDDGVQYNSRNIMPNVANENMYKFGGNIYANGGSSIEAKRDATLVVGNQPKPSFKENKKNPVKDISEDILPLPGFRDKPEDTELIKLIKERQIKPRGPKQPYELASGAVTPTASPIDAAVVSAAGIPQLVGRGVAGALPYLDAPLTIGSKVLPSVTANNLLNAAGAAYSGEQIINPESDLRTNPNAENILMTGLGLVGLPYKAAGMKGFNKPIKKPSVSNVDKIDNTDEFKNAIEKQLDEQLDELDKEIYKFFEEQKKLDALPETKNKESLSVLEDFKTRIQTPEGKKRIKELGIDNDELLQKIKIVEDPNTFGYYAPIKNKIVLNPYFPLPKKVTRHEIEHAVQHAFQTPKTTKIDDLLSGLELKKQGTPNKQWDYSKIVNDSPVDISQYKSLISNEQNATDYFLTGSGGKERSAFLSEIQQYMMDQGILPKTSYAEVTPEMVKNTFVDAMFDETGGGKYLRLFNIMKPTEANYKLISEGLNKMLGLTPYLGTGYLGYKGLQGQEKISQKQEYKYGGNMNKHLYVDGGLVEKDGMFVANRDATNVVPNSLPKQFLNKNVKNPNIKLPRITERVDYKREPKDSEVASFLKREIPTALPYIKSGKKKFEEKLADVTPDYESIEDREMLFKRHRPVAYPSVTSAIGDVVKDYSSRVFNTELQKPFRDKEGDYDASEEAWRMTLGLPVKQKYIIPSKYRPLNETEPNSRYYTLNEKMYNKNKLREKIKELKLQPGQSAYLDSFAPFVNEDYMNEGEFSQIDPLQRFKLGVNKNGKMYFYDKYDFDFEPLSKVVRPYEYEFYNEFANGGNMKLNKYNYGGYMYPNGGNTLYVNDPNDPRLKAYNDSTYLYENTKGDIDKLKQLQKKHGDIKAWQIFTDDLYGETLEEYQKRNSFKIQNFSNALRNLENLNNKPVTPEKIYQKNKYLNIAEEYKKPVQPVEYQKLDKIPTINKFNVETPNNIIDSIIRPNQEVTIPKVFVDEYTGYNNPNIPKGRIKYGKGKTDEFAYGGNLYPLGGPSILTQSNIQTGEAQAKENTVLDKQKEAQAKKPINNPSLYSGKPKQDNTTNIISGVGSGVAKEIDRYSSYKPVNTAPIDLMPKGIKTDPMQTQGQPIVSSDQLDLGPELNLDTSKSSFNNFNNTSDIKAPNITSSKTSKYDAKGASTIGGTASTAVDVGNMVYNATKNVDDEYNTSLANNEKYNKEYSEAQEKYKKDKSIVDATATTLGTIGTVMSAIPVVNLFSWIPGLLAAGTKAIGDPIVDADYESNTKEASVRNFNIASPEEYNRSMKVADKNTLAPESSLARYGGKKYSYGGNIYKNGGKTNSLEGDLISKVIMNRNKDKDFVQRAYAVGEYPESNMFTRFDPNQFGQKNSHLMSWGEDKSGQAYMFPEVMNPNNEAIKVPNQYADYISSQGYKKATGMQYANGGMTMYNMPKGLTHEQHPYGGYPIGNNNYVESDEVVLDKPDGSKYIFSNRIKYKR